MSNDQDNKKAIATHGNGFYSYPSLPKLYHIHAKKYRKTAILLASCQLSTVFYALLITIIFRPGQGQRLEQLQ